MTTADNACSITIEVYSSDRIRVCRQCSDTFSTPYIPYFDRFIKRAGDEEVALWAEFDGEAKIGMTFEFDQCFTLQSLRLVVILSMSIMV